jgi:hypothetical protein
MPTIFTREIVNAAIQGFEIQRANLNSKIQLLRQMLDGDPAEPAATPKGNPPRRKISAAVRRRMAMAQKARWAKLKGKVPSA